MISRSSAEPKLIAVDDKISKVIWSKRFTEAQEFKVSLSIIFQDNASTTKLVKNGRLSSENTTRHFDIRLFYATDLIIRKKVVIKCCLTGKILADHLSKPLVGKLFQMMRSDVVSIVSRE